MTAAVPARFVGRVLRRGPLIYPEGVTSEDGDTGPKRTPPRRFGQLPDLAITDDFDEPLLPDEIEAWETPDDPASPADSGALKEEWPIDDLDDWPFDDPSIDVAALHKSLLGRRPTSRPAVRSARKTSVLATVYRAETPTDDLPRPTQDVVTGATPAAGRRALSRRSTQHDVHQH